MPFYRRIWASVDFGILRGSGMEPIPHGYQRTTVLTMTLMITGKKLCLVKYNEFRFAELLVMQSNTFLKPYTYKVKVTSECLEDITALCQSKSPSAPCYPRGSRDVNIFLTTLFHATPSLHALPLWLPYPRRFQSTLHKHASPPSGSLAFHWDFYTLNSKTTHGLTVPIPKSIKQTGYARIAQDYGSFVPQYKSLVTHPRDSWIPTWFWETARLENPWTMPQILTFCYRYSFLRCKKRELG